MPNIYKLLQNPFFGCDFMDSNNLEQEVDSSESAKEQKESIFGYAINFIFGKGNSDYKQKPKYSEPLDSSCSKNKDAILQHLKGHY